MNIVTHAPRRASPCESAHHWSAQASGPVAADLTLTDRSLQSPRWGCKGPAAPQWLAERGLPVPPDYNSYRPLATGGLVARLGVTEFLIELRVIALYCGDATFAAVSFARISSNSSGVSNA